MQISNPAWIWQPQCFLGDRQPRTISPCSGRAATWRLERRPHVGGRTQAGCQDAAAAEHLTRGGGANFGLLGWWQGAILLFGYGPAFTGDGSLTTIRRDIT
jgi:hypothetical protein